jgi:hypothetical protein
MEMNIAAMLPGGMATLNQALANPKVSSLARSLAIDLGNQETVSALLAQVFTVLEKDAASPKVSGCSAAFSLGFNRVAPGKYVPAVLQAYRDIAAL